MALRMPRTGRLSGLTPRAAAMAGRTSAGCCTSARSTNWAEWGAEETARMAVRVLPTPPGPVRVTSRTSLRRKSAWTSPTSRSLPTNDVRGTGRARGSGCRSFGTGKILGSPSRDDSEDTLRDIVWRLTHLLSCDIRNEERGVHHKD